MASPRSVSCAFCAARIAVPPGAVKKGDKGEHLWPAWVAKLIRKANPTQRLFQFFTLQGDSLVMKRRQAVHFKQPVVCTGCNNGWMSVLENDVRSFLTNAVVNATPMILASGTSERFALWAAKNAVVLDHIGLLAGNRKVPFYSPAERFAIQRYSRIPANIAIRLFRNTSLQFSFAKGTYSESTPSTRNGDLRNRRVFSATFSYVNLGVQVVKVRTVRPARNAGSLLIRPASGWADHTTDVWPEPSRPHQWPPRLSLSTLDELWEFAHQWTADKPSIPPVDKSS